MSVDVLDAVAVRKALLKLSWSDREAAVRAGMISLEEDDFGPAEDPDEVERAWNAEIRRRLDDLDAGRVQLVSGAECEARVDALLAKLDR
jgi:predicted transcriptional regulator